MYENLIGFLREGVQEAVSKPGGGLEYMASEVSSGLVRAER